MKQEDVHDDEAPSVEDAGIQEVGPPACPVCGLPTAITVKKGISERRCVAFPECPGEIGYGQVLPFPALEERTRP